MICLFPSGLFHEDLTQLSKLRFIPEEWDTLLQKILNSKDASSKLIKPATPESHRRSTERKLTFGPGKGLTRTEEKKSTANLKIEDSESEKIKAGNYYWLQIHKDATRKGLFFQPSQSVCSYIKRSLKSSIHQAMMEKFEYMSILALSLINGARDNYYYNERLVENSLISEHGVWKIRGENYIYKKYLDASSRELTYLETLEGQSFKELKNVFWSHDANFLTLLEADIVNDLLNHSGNYIFFTRSLRLNRYK